MPTYCRTHLCLYSARTCYFIILTTYIWKVIEWKVVDCTEEQALSYADGRRVLLQHKHLLTHKYSTLPLTAGPAFAKAPLENFRGSGFWPLWCKHGRQTHATPPERLGMASCWPKAAMSETFCSAACKHSLTSGIKWTKKILPSSNKYSIGRIKVLFGRDCVINQDSRK